MGVAGMAPGNCWAGFADRAGGRAASACAICWVDHGGGRMFTSASSICIAATFVLSSVPFVLEMSFIKLSVICLSWAGVIFCGWTHTCSGDDWLQSIPAKMRCAAAVATFVSARFSQSGQHMWVFIAADVCCLADRLVSRKRFIQNLLWAFLVGVLNGGIEMFIYK